ncbi:MAG: 30S ribosomal protein S9 [Verrucomicrobiales bacterium]|jgi:small subunit ribosomal protein S9|nr:30S ribosomal protein S9 [Verrucomicrobiales bacterium]
MADKQIFMATGRRKTAVARVNLKAGKGTVTVNNKAAEDYFVTPEQRIELMLPLVLTENQKKFDVQIRTEGGGLQGQAGAASLAISRALIQVDKELRPALKAKGLLTRDSRMKERKKSGQPGARKRFQFSKR